MSISTTSPFMGSDKMIITPRRKDYLSSKLQDTTPYSEKPYMTSVNLSYTKPAIALYENLNADPRLHKRMTIYYRYKFIDKWLDENIDEIKKYFKKNKSIEEIKDILENKILTKNKVYSILVSFTNGTKTNWYDLHKNEKYLTEAFLITIRKEIKHLNK